MASLAEALFYEPEIGEEDFITGDVLLNWIGNLSTTLARQLRRDRDRYYLTPDMVLYHAIFRCDPTRPYIFPDKVEVNTAEEWIAHALQLLRLPGNSSEKICSNKALYQLECWLRFKMPPAEEMADRVDKILASPPSVRLEELLYLIQPDRPFTIARGLIARTPQEFAQIAYGSARDWEKKRPFCYDAAYQRWYDGCLFAWLRQRDLAELAARGEELHAQLGENHAAAFETVLRLLAPSLPPVRMEVTYADKEYSRTISYGQQRVFPFRYRTIGSGVPFGSIQVLSSSSGVRVDDYLLRGREGTFEITVDSRQDLLAFKTYELSFTLKSGIAELVNSPVKFSYRIFISTTLIYKRLFAGMGLGAAVFGIPRLVATLINRSAPHSLATHGFPSDLDQILHNRFPLAGHALMLLLLLVGLYYAIHIWISALLESEV